MLNTLNSPADPFYDREQPLGVLHGASNSGVAELVVVSGRRRVGKSELIKQALVGKPHVYYVGARKSEPDLLAEFTEQVYALTQQTFLRQQPFSSWDAAFSYLGDRAQSGRIIVAVDELPYMCEASPSLPSVIQRWWDARGRELPIVLILAGSYVGFMENLVKETGELFGRRTRQISLQPFDYYDAARFFPAYSSVDKMRAYAILGGMPAYLARFDPGRPLADNIAEQILSPGQLLREEGRWVLVEELRTEATYHSIMGAIARGKTRRGEIAQHVGADNPSAIGPYLERLSAMRLIRRVLPVTEDPTTAARRGLHVVEDNYLRFWFTYVDPNGSYLEDNQQALVLDEKILPTLDQFTSAPVFEEAARQYLRRRRAVGAVPVHFDRIGSWWSSVRGDALEIDIVATDGGAVRLIGECKWTNERVKIGDLNELRRKAASAGFPVDVGCALFSRSGFDPNLSAAAQAEGVLLVHLDDMYADDLAAEG